MLQMVVAYDIRNDTRRSRVAKCLNGYGERVNFSVFECVLKPGSFRKMKKELGKLINRKDDSVRIYLLCSECIGKTEVLGYGVEGFSAPGLTYV